MAEPVTLEPSGWMHPDREIHKLKIGLKNTYRWRPLCGLLGVLPSCSPCSGVCLHSADTVTEAKIILLCPALKKKKNPGPCIFFQLPGMLQNAAQASLGNCLAEHILQARGGAASWNTKRGRMLSSLGGLLVSR